MNCGSGTNGNCTSGQNSAMLKSSTITNCANICHYIEGCFGWNIMADSEGVIGVSSCIVFDNTVTFDSSSTQQQGYAFGLESSYSEIMQNQGQCGVSCQTCDPINGASNNCYYNTKPASGAITCGN